MKTYLSKDQMLYAENEEEATVYVGLKMMFDKMLTKDKEEVEISFNLKQLYHELSGNYNLTKYIKPKLERGLQGLLDADVIELIDTDGKGEYVIDVVGLTIDSSKEAYTMMDRQEIRDIFNISCKNNFNLLRFAVGLFGTLNSYNKCGWTSFNNMPYLTNVPERTCKDYFKLLEENNIIYVRHSKQAKRDRNGQIKNLSNVYGRPCDKEAIDNLYEERSGEQGHDFTNNLSSTKRGQISRSYNKFVKGSFNGDVMELIKDCLAFNAQPYNEQHEEAQKDMSVFDTNMVAEAQNELKPHIKKLKQEDKQEEIEERRKELLEPKSPSGFSFALDGDDLW